MKLTPTMMKGIVYAVGDSILACLNIASFRVQAVLC